MRIDPPIVDFNKLCPFVFFTTWELRIINRGSEFIIDNNILHEKGENNYATDQKIDLQALAL